jgi:hypothetical protein
VPIVFIHQGVSPYLEFTLRQARAADPDADIVLLGDASNDRYPFVRHVDATAPAYAAAAAEVGAVYRHLSTNRAAFELGCFERWFRLRAFLQAEDHADVLVLDSDVLLFAPEAAMRRTHFEGVSLGLAHPRAQPPFGWTTSAHISYWTADRLADFCAFVVRSYAEPAQRARYEEKWEHHVATRAPGGVCDMTALYLYAGEVVAEGTSPTFVNLLSVRDGATFDLNAGIAENEWPGEYAIREGLKAVRFEDGHPVVRNERTQTDVRFHALHLQGHAKARIPAFYRGPSFAGDRAIARSMAGHYRLRTLASRLIQPVRRLAVRLQRR